MTQRLVGAVQLVLVGVRERARELEAAVLEDGRRGIERAQLRLRAAGPRLGRAGGAQRFAQRAQQLDVQAAAARRRGDGLLQVRGRSLRLAERSGPERRGFAQERHPLALVGEREQRLEHPDPLAGAAEVAVQALELAQHLDVLRRRHARASPARPRRGRETRDRARARGRARGAARAAAPDPSPARAARPARAGAPRRARPVGGPPRSAPGRLASWGRSLRSLASHGSAASGEMRCQAIAAPRSSSWARRPPSAASVSCSIAASSSGQRSSRSSRASRSARAAASVGSSAQRLPQVALGVRRAGSAEPARAQQQPAGSASPAATRARALRPAARAGDRPAPAAARSRARGPPPAAGPARAGARGAAAAAPRPGRASGPASSSASSRRVATSQGVAGRASSVSSRRASGSCSPDPAV